MTLKIIFIPKNGGEKEFTIESDAMPRKDDYINIDGKVVGKVDRIEHHFDNLKHSWSRIVVTEPK